VDQSGVKSGMKISFKFVQGRGRQAALGRSRLVVATHGAYIPRPHLAEPEKASPSTRPGTSRPAPATSFAKPLTTLSAGELNRSNA
jgi:hypothetical protein